MTSGALQGGRGFVKGGPTHFVLSPVMGRSFVHGGGARALLQLERGSTLTQGSELEMLWQ